MKQPTIAALVRNLIVFTLLATVFGGAALAQGGPDNPAEPDGPFNIPLVFIENVGQFNEAARYLARSPRGDSLWLTESEMWVTLYAAQQTGDDESAVLPQFPGLDNDEAQGVNLKFSFVGGNPAPRIEGFNNLKTTVNFITPSAGVEAPVWGSIRYVDLYPGLDLEIIAAANNTWVWRLVVKETADGLLPVPVRADDTAALIHPAYFVLDNIRLKVEGFNSLAINSDANGQKTLRIFTQAGQFDLPLLQVVDSRGVPLELPSVRPAIEKSEITMPFSTGGGSGPTTGDGSITATPTPAEQDAPPNTPPANNNPFEAEPTPVPLEFDTVAPLVAPPIVPDPEITSNLLYSLFLGGGENDCFPRCAIAVDAGGSVYVTGHTASVDFPSKPGAFKTANDGGDIFVVKINPDGSGFDYATFIGGSGSDYGTAIAVDSQGHAYITGYTDSPDFPDAGRDLGLRYRGGYSDIFVVKLASDGSDLVYAALLGGEAADRAYGLAVDREGAAYITGETHSPDFPYSAEAPRKTYSGEGDAFVLKLNPSGSGLDYSTFLGGSKADLGQAIAVGLAGRAYITGKTASTDFPVTAASLSAEHNGLVDAFVVKLNRSGSAYDYATFLGGKSVDQGEGIAVDANGAAYVTGSTISRDFPATENAFRAEHNGSYDAFVAKLTPDGGGLTYATFLGGDNGDRGYAIDIDGAGSAYVTGATFSQNFPITGDTFDDSYNFGFADAFFTRLLPDGSDITYATFLGGSDPDYGTGIAVDGAGSAYLTGATLSPSFPGAVNSLDPYHNGRWDGFVAKLAFGGQGRTSLISGVVLDREGNPIPDVVISAGAKGSATTDSNGVYVLIGLGAGTYNLRPIKAGYTFSPARRTVNVPNNDPDLNFIAVAGAETPEPFLDLPLAYNNAVSNFVQALQDVDGGGFVTSWFDHNYPDYGKNQRLVLDDGLTRAENAFNQNLGCFEDRCYDGHDGLDLIYRDYWPGKTAERGVPVFAAAAGEVVSLETNCQAGDRNCGNGFGNFVVLDHKNGYFTLYGHMADVQVIQGDTLQRGDTLALMDNTGNSTGFHLHFGVYQDNGNGQWDGGKTDKVVDPFGWRGNSADPWVADLEGPISHYLWKYPLASEKAIVGSEGGTLVDSTGRVEAAFPAQALNGQADLELFLGSAAAPAGDKRSAGQSFWLRLVEWLPNEQELPDSLVSISPNSALARPITLNIAFDEADIQHLDTSQLQVNRWLESSRSWQPLPTTVNETVGIVTAQTASLGQFDLQAPLLCPADSVEPDDHYYSAQPIEADGKLAIRLFDIAEDEDWFYFEARAGNAYIIETEQLALDVDTKITLFDLSDGGETLTDDDGGLDLASRLEWLAPHDGVYYIRVSRFENEVFGCQASYQLRIATADAPVHQTFLPFVSKY